MCDRGRGLPWAPPCDLPDGVEFQTDNTGPKKQLIEKHAERYQKAGSPREQQEGG